MCEQKQTLTRRDLMKVAAATVGGVLIATLLGVGCGGRAQPTTPPPTATSPAISTLPLAPTPASPTRATRPTSPPATLAPTTTLAPTGGQPPLRAQYALGVQRVLVLAVSFPGIEPGGSLSQIGDGLKKIEEYYANVSYGKTQLVGEVKGWYRLPRSLEDYKVSPYNVEVDPSRVLRLVQDTFNAAEKDVQFSRYNHVIILVGVDTRPGEGYGMVAYNANPGMLSKLLEGQGVMHKIKTQGGQEFDRGIVVAAQTARAGHVVHDLAHAIGGVVAGQRVIPDLYDVVLQGKLGPLTEETYLKFTGYVGPWDVLSRHVFEGAEFPPGMSSFTRLRMGWIADRQMVEVLPGESRQVTLKPLAGGEGTLVIKIPGPGGIYYQLENRQKLPGDPVVPAKGLLILQVDESKPDGRGIVRVVDANPKVPDFGAATFGRDPGQTPSTTLAGVSGEVVVEVVSQQGQDLVVRVSKR